MSVASYAYFLCDGLGKTSSAASTNSVTSWRIRPENLKLKLSSAGTPSSHCWLSPTSESHSVITQRALQRATWHEVGTWRFSRLRIAPHPVTRLLQFSVSLFPTPRDFVQDSFPTCRRYGDKLDGAPGERSVWLRLVAEHRAAIGSSRIGMAR